MSLAQKQNAQIEEDDLFKFNCEKIDTFDQLSLQLVVCTEDLDDLYGYDNQELFQKVHNELDDDGLLVLAKADISLPYLMKNNLNSIREAF